MLGQVAKGIGHVLTVSLLLQPRVTTYFTRVNDIIKKGQISSRVRFALQDVVDLRDNKWIPRQRQDSQVKTIDQIHREALDEKQLTKQIASQYVEGGVVGGFGRRDSSPSVMEDKRRGPKPGQEGGGEEGSNVEKWPQQSRPDLERICSFKKPGDKEESSGQWVVYKWGSKGPAFSIVDPPGTAENLSKYFSHCLFNSSDGPPISLPPLFLLHCPLLSPPHPLLQVLFRRQAGREDTSSPCQGYPQEPPPPPRRSRT